MSQRLEPARASRERCVSAVARIIAKRHGLGEIATAHLLWNVRMDLADRRSAARTLANARRIAHDLSKSTAPTNRS